MKICEHHNTTLRGALASRGVHGLDPLFQAQALIIQNVAAQHPALLAAPPTICPLCQLPLREAFKWISECAMSIAHERKP